ncbi:LOW QUALITY PROTEIN: zinc finger protein 449-like [Anoplopoma fimbria]|uniref:LOW QUALITY PROTEIN: zinc finger protein 449-like n=1 Tax=Anoplopoma fimbria TaxID=229290 RepID=UPI0023ECF9B5|nr:LOW QUALITY PROTEIN: zinc finger protein 449-like [Anoplopoma fimbria]
MMEESVSTFETHLTAVMDSLIRASVCEITKLFQDMVNDYLVELSLNRKENDALKQRLRLTENKLRSERKYGMGWAANRRNAGLTAAEEGAGGRQKRRVEVARGKSKKGPAAVYGKGWPGGVWEEGGGGGGGGGGGRRRKRRAGAVGMVAGAGGRGRGKGKGGKEAREMYLIQFPGDEEDEGGMMEDEEGEGSLSGEGEETANIKEEFAQTEGYQPASLQLIKEALKMDPPNQNLHTCSRAQSKGDLSDPHSSLHSEERDDEDWESDSAEPSEGGMTMDELRGLESALRAERGREQAAMTASEPVSPDSEVEQGSKSSLAPKYIGLDGMEHDEELEPPTLQREEQIGQGRAKDAVRAGAELRSGWLKKSREDDSAASVTGEEVVEQEESENLPHLCAPGSVGESGGEEEGGGDLLHFCPQCGGGFTSQAELEEHPCPLGASHLENSEEEGLFPCAHCGNTFSHSWALKNHECACAAERPHCCEICGKRFTHSRSLERHQVVHTGERPHRCTQCGRSFSRLGNLERHLRIHTGERPYGCEACGKRFSRVEYLKRHQLIHSSERRRSSAPTVEAALVMWSN